MHRSKRLAGLKNPKKELPAIKPREKTRNAIQESSPVFVFGRGGSGTRVISEMVQELGFFFGNRINVSKDSIDWKHIIVGLAINEGAQIELPLEISKKKRDNLILTAEKSLTTKFGPKVLSKSIPPWGFKIPHLTLVFSLLGETFPNARFIHLVRHPIPSAVSKSRRKTDKTSRSDGGQGKILLPLAIQYSKGEAGAREKMITPYQLKEMPAWKLNAYSWNHHVSRAHEYGTQFLNDRYLEILYEDVCHRPQIEMNKVTEFLGLSKHKTKIEIKPSPSSRYDKNGINKGVWEICKEAAEKFGYTY